MKTVRRSLLKSTLSAVALASLSSLGTAWAQSSIVVASTTSTEQSGLFGHILPQFKQATGIDVKVVALGTGQAIDMARRGIHNNAAELLLERLEGKVDTDFATARRLFTLICVLHIKG
jgi:tungstate transport system substrate-binding protein